ncbi:putative ABC transport system permease protein [Catalinimonas alkaloidigena]|uniref:Putative ABC transport system permease protein n=1 Tax=Catalinimonas alkaloidigena TaxID=1075417 RepID=A0A1G9KG41_9BACT|nr:ABC transporter permease [Catalinimonas alkaloidigena]SDL48661.1 putative ABC transport system permease protein [Catalinimonas alkaloidigena]
MNMPSHERPPRRADRLLAWFCSADLLEEVQGDLHEEFAYQVQRIGEKRARRRYWWDVLGFIRLFALRRKTTGTTSNLSIAMLKNYLIIAFRHLQKNRVFTFINIAGVAIGMAGCLLILAYVRYELSYDRFHPEADQIYRVTYFVSQGDQEIVASAAAVPAVGPALKNNFPEVKDYARFYPINGIMTYQKKDGKLVAFREKKMQIATPSALTLFNLPLEEGDPATALEGFGKVVISQSAAKRYFGDEDPMGETLTWQDGDALQVTGVMRDLPPNSHIKFDFLISYQTLNEKTENGSEIAWGPYDFNTYVLLDPQTDPAQLQAKWDAWLEKERQEDWTKYNVREAFVLQPLTDIHLYSNLVQESEPDEQGNGHAVYFLLIIAGFILVIAWINYVNLSTARAMERAREVGIRKAVGAIRNQLMAQFLLESVVVNVVATIVAVGIVVVALPHLATLTGQPLAAHVFTQPQFWLVLGALFLVGALLSGFYPALMLSSFQPVKVLKGKLTTSSGGTRLRKALVVFQFGASVALIAGTGVVFKQIQFMLQQDLGIDIEQTLVLKGVGSTDSTYTGTLHAFKDEMIRKAGVSSITAASNVPGDEIFWTNILKRISGGPEGIITVYTVGIDYDYVPAFGLKLTAGRNFSLDFPSDSGGVLLNAAATKMLLYDTPEEALGEWVNVGGGDTLQVVGVLADYHQMALKYTQAPIVFRLDPSPTNFYALKIKTDDLPTTLESIQQEWQQFFPGNPFDYFFLDEFFNRQYESDQLFGRVFTWFAGLAIFVACLGLFGLAAFTTVQRTKEIGVRKVLGASVGHIVSLLSREFVLLILLGSVLAIPLAYLLMHRWLDTYPFRVDLSGWYFLLPLVLAIAMLTVSYQTIKAALANPVDGLRSE